jgi:hypothetical protein
MLAEAMMTPEEQFMKIENALRHSAEIQDRQAGQIEVTRSAIRDIMIAIGKLTDSQQRLTDSELRLVESHLGVLDSQKLIEETIAALSRAQAEEQEARKLANKEFDAKFNALLQAQLETENKLQRWIDRQGHA